MRYHVIHIKTSFPEEWKKDVFDQSLCNFGVDCIDGENYYIPSELWAKHSQQIMFFCVMHEDDGFVRFVDVQECPDENWNAAWEAEHPMQELPLGVKIVPHCAFGAGHHETTSMMINELIQHQLTIKNYGFRVLDHGTGTGVLAIFAKKLGAKEVVAIDIDDKSVQNAQENAALNGVEIEVQLGSTPPKEGHFDLILANIHRNILLENMPAYAACLAEGGELWLSGFYEEDCAVLEASAKEQGLALIEVLSNGEWRMMKCRNKELR